LYIDSWYFGGLKKVLEKSKKAKKKTKKFWKNHLKFSKENGTFDTVVTVVTVAGLLVTF